MNNKEPKFVKFMCESCRKSVEAPVNWKVTCNHCGKLMVAEKTKEPLIEVVFEGKEKKNGNT